MQELFKTNLIICSVYLNKKRRLLEKQTAFKTKFKNSFTFYLYAYIGN